jgi:hypothetical protein
LLFLAAAKSSGGPANELGGHSRSRRRLPMRRGDPVARRPDHHGGLLDLIRQPRGDTRARPHDHVCRDRAQPRAGLRCGTARRRGGRGRGLSNHLFRPQAGRIVWYCGGRIHDPADLFRHRNDRPTRAIGAARPIARRATSREHPSKLHRQRERPPLYGPVAPCATRATRALRVGRSNSARH